MKGYLQQLAKMGAYNFWREHKDGEPWPHTSPADYILDRGKDFTSTETLTEEQYGYLMGLAEQVQGAFGKEHFRPKECFENAMLLTVADHLGSENRLIYCEGYCNSGLLPVLHAWVLLDGKLVDTTRSLRAEATDEFLAGKDPQANLKDRVLGVIPKGWTYLGLEFQSPAVTAYIRETEATGSLIDDWQRQYPLLQQESRNGPPPDFAQLRQLLG